MRFDSRRGMAVALLFLLWMTEGATGRTIHVPGDYAAIGPAVGAAASGDIILVGPGLWSGGNNRGIDLGDKNLTIQSTAGAAATTIECGRAGPGFIIDGGQSSQTSIDGFTIRSASPDGIEIRSSSPGIVNCIAQACSPNGIACDNAPATISNCILKESGRGLSLVQSDVAVTGCTISDNGVNTDMGGGISCDRSAAVFTACSILNNIAAVRSGGVYCVGDPSPTFYVCSIAGNQAPQGGGVGIDSGAPRFELCSITGNRGSAEGGGLYAASSSPAIVASTIARNAATTGAGVYLDGAVVSMERTILWGNCGGATDGRDSYLTAPSVMTVTCCDIDPAGSAGPGSVVYDGDPLLTDPHFCNMGPCGPGATIQGNFYLAFDSPCVSGPCGQRIGAFEAICSETAIKRTTWGRVRAAYR